MGRIRREEVGRFPVRGGEEFVDQIDEDLEGDAPLLRGGAGAEGEAAHYVREGADDGDAGRDDMRVHMYSPVSLLEVGFAQENAGAGVPGAERVDGV